MAPVVEYLCLRAQALPITTPGHYYFAAGLFSAVLDNTPTYALFLQMKLSQFAAIPGAGAGPAVNPGASPAAIAGLLQSHSALAPALAAISCGAVFFGAVTYLGNGPNLMVKALVESAGHKTPGFLGYILRYALPVLAPVYVLVWWLFFR
jgi:Na+/H+ antiporter NhaD/arsenite permease-like protein